MDVRTTTAALDPGAAAPEFRDLPATDGSRYSLSSFAEARALAVVFISNECPTVRAYEDRLIDIHRRHLEAGGRLVAINANNPHLSPGDSLREMEERVRERRLPFPYLKDADGEVARAYGAISTPHAFVFDEERRLGYRGRVDDARDPARVTSPDLDDALGTLLEGRAIAVPVTEPFGGAIVW